MNTVEVKCRIVRETERALLIQQPLPDQHGTRECWIARSECHHISKGPLGADGSRDGTVRMSAWLAQVNALEIE